jgi:GNAT superfamily N-acetyltransferase
MEDREPSTPNHIIEVLRSPKDVRVWVQAWAWMAHPDSPGINHWTDVYKTFISRLPITQFQMFAARGCTPVGGRTPVMGTGFIHCFEGIASIHCLSVPPCYRKRGIGHDLLQFAMQQAYDLGYHVAMVTATKEILPMFYAASFRNVGEVKLYTFHPQAPVSQQPEQKADEPNQYDSLESFASESVGGQDHKMSDSGHDSDTIRTDITEMGDSDDVSVFSLKSEPGEDDWEILRPRSEEWISGSVIKNKKGVNSDKSTMYSDNVKI